MKENQQIIYYKRDDDDDEREFIPKHPYCNLIDDSDGEFYECSMQEIAQEIAEHEFYQISGDYFEEIKICITRVSTEEKPVNMTFDIEVIYSTPEFYAERVEDYEV